MKRNVTLMIDHCVGLMWKMEKGNLTSDETNLPSDISIKTCCYMTHILYTVKTLQNHSVCVCRCTCM